MSKSRKTSDGLKQPDDEVISEFVNEFLQDEAIVQKSRKVERLMYYMGGILFGELAIGFFYTFFPGFITGIVPAQLEVAARGLPLSVIQAIAFLAPFLMLIWFSYVRTNYDLSQTGIAIHYLARAAEDYQNEEYEDCHDSLTKFKSYSQLRNTAILQKKRETQIHTYVTRVSYATNRAYTIKKTFPGLFKPIAAELLELNEDNRVNSVLEELPTSNQDEEPSNLDLLKDLISPIYSLTHNRVALAVILFVSGIVVNSQFGYSTASLLIMVLGVVVGMGNRE